MKKTAIPSVFDQIAGSLKSGIAHARGEQPLKSVSFAPPPPAARPKQITALREQLNMSQTEFAATLNVTPRTVRVWEQGRQRPSHASLRLLQLLQADPRVIDLIRSASPASNYMEQ